MLFSVIVPVYNVAEYLPKCMESLVHQPCRDYEIILVDDGSTDGRSGSLCDEYGAEYPDLVRVIHQENQGQGGARNNGVGAARGEYLFFVDSDDYIAPNALAVLEKAVRDYGADMYLFRYEYVQESGSFPCEASGLPEGQVLNLSSCPELVLHTPSPCFRIEKRSLLTEHTDLFPKRIWFEDLYTTPKWLLYAEKIVVLPDVLYSYYLRDGSTMHNPNYARNKELLTCLEELNRAYRAAGASREVMDYLCVQAVDNALLAAERVLMANPKSDILPDFVNYLKERYPEYRKNPYLSRLGKKKLMVLRFLELRQYSLLKFLFTTLHRIRK